MSMKVSREFKKLIGKLPDGWDKMTLEEKISQVHKKWRLLSQDDMYDLHIYSWNDCYPKCAIDPNGDHQFTEDGSCFAIPNPSPDGQVDVGKFPEYLREYINNQAYEDWDTNKKYTCMLYSDIEGPTFEKVVEKMWFFLDLLTCGYEMTEIEWYKEEHSSLFPDEDEDDDDWNDEEEEYDELDEDEIEECDDMEKTSSRKQTVQKKTDMAKPNIFEEAFATEHVQGMKDGLPVLLGEYAEEAGKSVIDLCEAPHVLIVGNDDDFGATALMSEFQLILASLLYRHNPNELSFLLIDTQDDIFYEYSNSLDTPKPVANIEQCKESLQWLCGEMERRYSALSNSECRSMKEYNSRHPVIMPYIVVCISDVADVRAKAKNSLANLTDVLRKGKAAGIHVIVATRKPNAKVLPTDFLMNFPVRIALELPRNAKASKFVVNRTGAEDICADQKFVLQDMSQEAKLVNSPCVTGKEFNAIIEKFKKRK